MELRDPDRDRGETRRWWSVKKSTNERERGSLGRLQAVRRAMAQVKRIPSLAIIDQKSVGVVLVLVTIADLSHRLDRDPAAPDPSSRDRLMPEAQEGQAMYSVEMVLSRRPLHQDNKVAAGVRDLEATCLRLRPLRL
jgi:hypothetical protein